MLNSDLLLFLFFSLFFLYDHTIPIWPISDSRVYRSQSTTEPHVQVNNNTIICILLLYRSQYWSHWSQPLEIHWLQFHADFCTGQPISLQTNPGERAWTILITAEVHLVWRRSQMNSSSAVYTKVALHKKQTCIKIMKNTFSSIFPLFIHNSSSSQNPCWFSLYCFICCMHVTSEFHSFLLY